MWFFNLFKLEFCNSVRKIDELTVNGEDLDFLNIRAWIRFEKCFLTLFFVRSQLMRLGFFGQRLQLINYQVSTFVLCIHFFIYHIVIWQKKVSLLMFAYFTSSNQVLKYNSDETNSWYYKCSIFLGLNFVSIKKSFTKIFPIFWSLYFTTICYWKKTYEGEPF